MVKSNEEGEEAKAVVEEIGRGGNTAKIIAVFQVESLIRSFKVIYGCFPPGGGDGVRGRVDLSVGG